ncbi:hypothetical protein ACFSC4_24215 [Deinococcus malanensis]
MTGTLTPALFDDQQQILAALNAFRRGDFSVRLPMNWDGVSGKIADTFNELLEESQRISQDIARVGLVVGKEGNTKQRIPLGTTTGGWAS